jgi:D-alanine-D-alanine ligase
MARLSVGVVFGGRSVEHDVSIVSAHQLMDALAERHDIVPIYITREGRWLSGPGLNDIAVHQEGRADEAGEEAFIPPVAGYGGLMVPGGRLRGARRIRLDVVIPAIHGTFGEDGTLQGVLEMADVAYAGSGVAASAVGMDKAQMKAAFRAAGLPVVDHVLVEIEELDARRDEVLASLETTIGYPAFVKPARVGSSVGIGKAADSGELLAALEVARAYDRRILVERAVEGCIEINCSVLGGLGRGERVSVLEQPLPLEEALTFSDKYLRGGKAGGTGGKKHGGMANLDRRLPAELPDDVAKQVQANAVAAFKAVDAAGVARIDSFVKEETGETWVMEINTTPGSFAFYLWEASGMPFAELADELLRIALGSHRAKGERLYTFDSGLLKAGGGAKAGG